MKICEHIISTSEIIGIGPLMVKASADTASRTLYNSKQLHFQVHCKYQSILIESPWFDVGFGDILELREEEKKARDNYQKFINEYDVIKKQVSDLIQTLAEYDVKFQQ